MWKGAPPFTCLDWARVWGLRGPAPAPPETLLLAGSSPGHPSLRPCCQRSTYPTVCPRDQPPDPDSGYEGQLWPGPTCLSPAPRGRPAGRHRWPGPVSGQLASLAVCTPAGHRDRGAPGPKGTVATPSRAGPPRGSPQLRGRQASAERRGGPRPPRVGARGGSPPVGWQWAHAQRWDDSAVPAVGTAPREPEFLDPRWAGEAFYRSH